MAEQTWIQSSGTLHGKPISIQHVQNWQHIQEAGGYETCVQIAWTAVDVEEGTGFPALSEQVKILTLSEQLQTLEQSHNSALTMMITYDGVNQWVIYVRDLEQFKQELASIEADMADYPLEMVANLDPNWDTFSQVYQQLEQPV